MSHEKIKRKKGDIYALSLPDNKGYIYVYFIAGNAQAGELMNIFDYSTKELESNIQKILLQPSLYKQNPFIGHIDLEDERYIKVGNVKPDYNEYINKPIYLKGSIECGNIWDKYRPFSEHDLKGQWHEMLKDLKNGVQYHCSDWMFSELQITTLRGKLEIMPNMIHIGKLNSSQQDILTYHVFPNEDDYIEKYLTGYDRNSILYSLYL
jgi:hypothetical protein